MISRSIIAAALGSFVLTVAIFGMPTSAGTVSQGAHPLQLRYLGIVDGKSYFAEVNDTFTWVEGAAYCEASNLNMVTIVEETVRDYLVEKLEIFEDAFYWTSARDSRLPSMLVWNDTETHPNTTLLPNWIDVLEDFPYYLCGAFGLVENIPIMAVVPCTEKRYLLCQG